MHFYCQFAQNGGTRRKTVCTRCERSTKKGGGEIASTQSQYVKSTAGLMKTILSSTTRDNTKIRETYSR